MRVAGQSALKPSDIDIEDLCARVPLRAKALIVTIFGDSLVAHGGGVWLSSLIEMAALFGISERRVRTAVYRLKQDGLLTARRSGRQSYYQLTDDARRQFHNAERRIYALPADHWDRKWTIVLLPAELSADDRARLSQELKWSGFAALAPNVLAHPGGAAAEDAAPPLPDPADPRLLTLEANTVSGFNPDLVRQIIAQHWELAAIATGYRQFIEVFGPLEKRLASATTDDSKTCFVLRTLLIDQYRKILLKDPALPLPLLPAQWPGRRAAEITQRLYRITAMPGQDFVMRMIDGDQAGRAGPLPARFLARFGGL